jgi:hypothetical protein
VHTTYPRHQTNPTVITSHRITRRLLPLSLYLSLSLSRSLFYSILLPATLATTIFYICRLRCIVFSRIHVGYRLSNQSPARSSPLLSSPGCESSAALDAPHRHVPSQPGCLLACWLLGNVVFVASCLLRHVCSMFAVLCLLFAVLFAVLFALCLLRRVCRACLPCITPSRLV